MLRRTLTLSLLACLASIGVSNGARAEDPAQKQSQPQMQQHLEEQLYGSQLMTEQERAEHRAKIRTAKTAEERERIRKEHHEKMKRRAKERGATLPDEPPPHGDGKGFGGMGPGGGAGPGGGVGPGGGMGPGGGGGGR